MSCDVISGHVATLIFMYWNELLNVNERPGGLDMVKVFPLATHE